MEDRRNFWLFSVGRLVSLTGTGVHNVAVPLFILDLTGSGLVMGMYMIIFLAPRLILYPLAGVLGDRFNRKWIMVWMDFGRGFLLLIMALLAARNMMTLSILFGTQFLISVMDALFDPSTAAMLPDIVKKEELTRANSVVGAIDSFSRIVGPIVGGILYGFGGITLALLVNGISFAGSGVSELFIRYLQKTKKIERVKEVVDDLKEGIHFVRTHRGLLVFLMLALGVNLFITPILIVLYPYVLRIVIRFSSQQYGILQTAFVAGIFVGNLIIGTLFAQTKIEKMLNRGLIAHIVLLFVFVALIFPGSIEKLGYASWTNFFVIFAVFVVMGIFNAFVNTPLNVKFQMLVPTEYRARVFAFIGVASQAVIPIGFGIIGILLDYTPVHIIALVLSAILLVEILVFVLKYSKEVTEGLEDEPPQEESGTSSM
jgi:DHA3 family macrolide efflux protein-like MFS transporter